MGARGHLEFGLGRWGTFPKEKKPAGQPDVIGGGNQPWGRIRRNTLVGPGTRSGKKIVGNFPKPFFSPYVSPQE